MRHAGERGTDRELDFDELSPTHTRNSPKRLGEHPDARGPEITFRKPVGNLSVSEVKHSFMCESNEGFLGLRGYDDPWRLFIRSVEVEAIPTGYVGNSLEVLEERWVTSLLDHPIFNSDGHRFIESIVR